MDQDRLVFLEDLVDDAVVTASGRVEALEFTHQWLPEPLRVLGDRPEDSLQSGVSDLVWEPDEVAQTLRGDVDLVQRADLRRGRAGTAACLRKLLVVTAAAIPSARRL